MVGRKRVGVEWGGRERGSRGDREVGRRRFRKGEDWQKIGRERESNGQKSFRVG